MMTKAQAEIALRAHLAPGSGITIVNGRKTRRQYTVVRFLVNKDSYALDLSQEIAYWLERPPLPHGLLLGRLESAETIVESLSTALFGSPEAIPWRYL